MALGLTEEHLELAEAVRGWAQRNCPPELVRAAADGADGGSARYLESLAPGLAEQGLLGLHLPEEDGGQGYGLPELAVALEELGRALVPGAFLPTVLASAVLASGAGRDARQAGGRPGRRLQARRGVAGRRPGRPARRGRRAGHQRRVRPGARRPVADLVIVAVATGRGRGVGSGGRRRAWRSPPWTASI